MITKEIAAEIWHCYNEIEQAEKMIETMQEKITTNGNLDLNDNWGNHADSLQLHIPSGHGSYHIKRVAPSVALQVIQEHIKTQNEKLHKLMDVCKIQLA